MYLHGMSSGAFVPALEETISRISRDRRYGAEFTRVRGEFLGDNVAASATIGIWHLAAPVILVEVQCTAVVRK